MHIKFIVINSYHKSPPSLSTTIENCIKVMPLQYAVHMNEDLWPQPHIYNPNRFIDENGKFFTPTNFIPFQTGKR
jgi:cytochrome P450